MKTLSVLGIASIISIIQNLPASPMWGALWHSLQQQHPGGELSITQRSQRENRAPSTPVPYLGKDQKFKGLYQPHKPMEAPILAQCCTFLACTLQKIVFTGEHVILNATVCTEELLFNFFDTYNSDEGFIPKKTFTHFITLENGSKIGVLMVDGGNKNEKAEFGETPLHILDLTIRDNSSIGHIDLSKTTILVPGSVNELTKIKSITGGIIELPGCPRDFNALE